MIADATARSAAARSEFTALESQAAGVEEGEEGLDAEYERASAVVDELQAELERAKQDERDAEKDRDALTARIEALQHDPRALRTEGIAIATELCDALLAGGAPGLHFYTLNRSRATREIYAALSLPA